jgi:lysophospholipase L1-like esterase
MQGWIAVAIGIASVIAVTLSAFTVSVVSRRLDFAGRTMSGRRRWTIAIVLGVISVAATHGAVRALAGAVGAALTWQGVAREFIQAASAVALAACAVAAGVCVVRLQNRFAARTIIGGVAAVYLAVGYPLTVIDEVVHQPHQFGSLFTWNPNTTFQDTFVNRPQLTYQMNRFGFRNPDWTIERKPGVRRIVVIGDSYVFGLGVGDTDTLAAQLQRALQQKNPAQPVEVLNLGIPGHNLPTHVEMYETAARRLAPDMAIVCLTLPNDMARWDTQTRKVSEGQFGALSFARFAFGDGAAAVFDWLWLTDRVTPEGLAILDAELARLERARLAAPSHPRTWLFAYEPITSELRTRLATHPNTPLVPSGDVLPDDYIPMDHHPTASGNRRFAGWIADAIDAESRGPVE